MAMIVPPKVAYHVFHSPELERSGRPCGWWVQEHLPDNTVILRGPFETREDAQERLDQILSIIATLQGVGRMKPAGQA